MVLSSNLVDDEFNVNLLHAQNLSRFLGILFLGRQTLLLMLLLMLVFLLWTLTSGITVCPLRLWLPLDSTLGLMVVLDVLVCNILFVYQKKKKKRREVYIITFYYCSKVSYAPMFFIPFQIRLELLCWLKLKTKLT